MSSPGIKPGYTLLYGKHTSPGKKCLYGEQVLGIVYFRRGEKGNHSSGGSSEKNCFWWLLAFRQSESKHSRPKRPRYDKNRGLWSQQIFWASQEHSVRILSQSHLPDWTRSPRHPMLDPPWSRKCWCWPKGSRPLGIRMQCESKSSLESSERRLSVKTVTSHETISHQAKTVRHKSHLGPWHN